MRNEHSLQEGAAWGSNGTFVRRYLAEINDEKNTQAWVKNLRRNEMTALNGGKPTACK